MNNDDELYRPLKNLVGRKCLWNGDNWLIMDIVSNEHSLVLKRLNSKRAPIQTDAYGNASRRVPETRVITYVDDKGEIPEEILGILEGLQQ